MSYYPLPSPLAPRQAATVSYLHVLVAGEVVLVGPVGHSTHGVARRSHGGVGVAEAVLVLCGGGGKTTLDSLVVSGRCCVVVVGKNSRLLCDEWAVL